VDIDLTKSEAEAMALPGMPDDGWLESTRDLLLGLRTSETPMDTLPVELVEAFTRNSR